MSSEKKAAASRRNGKSSRGPTSAEGKAKASGNATKHGILSERDLLPDEDQNLREALWAEHLVYFEPVGPVELGLTRRLLTLEWRALRAERGESVRLRRAFFEARERLLVGRATEFLDRIERVKDENDKFKTFYATPQGQQYERTVREADEARARMLAEPAEVGLALVASDEASTPIATIRRYQVSIERSYARTLKLLLEVQEARRKGKIGTPASSELDASADSGCATDPESVE